MTTSKIKFPKKLGKVSDMLYKNKLAIAEANKVVATLKIDKTVIEAHIISTFPKEDIDGVIGELSKIEIKTRDCYSVSDEDAFHKYIQKNKAWDLLQKRLGDTAIKLRLEDGKKLPFIKTFEKKVISCTKR